MEKALIVQFMEITACECQAAAVRHLSSCQWNLERAIDEFFASGGVIAGPSESPPVEEQAGVRAPIPARGDRLYSYYGNRSRTDRADQSMWNPPSPKPVPDCPIQATGWGDEPFDNGGASVKEAEHEHINKMEVSGCGEDDDKEEYYDVSDNCSDAVEEHDKEGDEKEEYYDVVSDSGDEIEDSDQEIEDDDGYDDYYDDDSLIEEEDEEEERPRPQPQASLAQMYRPPYELMYTGTFHDAKVHAATQDRFLLVNLQAQAEFRSMLHNRDLWANSGVGQVVKDNFVFQLLKKSSDGHPSDDEGTKVCTFYKVQDDQLPAVLVLDPITGKLLARRSGAIQPDEFMLLVEKYTDSKPSEMSREKIVPRAAAVSERVKAADSASGEQKPAAATPESSTSACAGGEKEGHEPVPTVEEAPADMADSEGDDDAEQKMYKLRVRFPDGSVVTKEFGCRRRVSKLFAFCRSTLRDGGKTDQNAFRIVRLAGRAFQDLPNNGGTFEELDLNMATVSVVFVA